MGTDAIASCSPGPGEGSFFIADAQIHRQRSFHKWFFVIRFVVSMAGRQNFSVFKIWHENQKNGKEHTFLLT